MQHCKYVDAFVCCAK